MLFNSIDFAVYLPVVFVLYWFVANRNLRLQNALIVAASFVFYGWWDWRFLGLLVFSAGIDFFTGLQLARDHKRPQTRKYLLGLSLLANLGILGFFKYYNFFITNFIEVFTLLGHRPEISTLKIILPVGVSFYTFQALSYTIDVYRGKLEPTRDIVAYFAYISFFPQLVAGPIERATRLLPQFYVKRSFDYSKATDGLRQMLWGLFKKMVVADNCAIYANIIFNDAAGFSGSTLVLGVVFFAFQIYGDFSGYSDIAIGTARLFGFDLMRNFAFPYFSRDIAEFWRRWHISLSTWFRDYVYIPLGGSRVGTLRKVVNIFAVFVVSGFWHGANWTFLVWGALNALYFLPLLLLKKNRQHVDTVASGRGLPTWREMAEMATTFGLTAFAWIFFRATSMEQATNYISGIFARDLVTVPVLMAKPGVKVVMVFILLLLLVEWWGREYAHGLARLRKHLPRAVRYAVYALIVFVIGMYMETSGTPFIYFQF
jgi:D-alanyl-lipoteichoic acid acyltransferase DltB (MBOAT superfamily)